MKNRKKQTARKTIGSSSPLRSMARNAGRIPIRTPRPSVRCTPDAAGRARRAQYFKDQKTGLYFHRTRRVGEGKLGAWGRGRVGTPWPYGICYDGKRFLANACKALCASAGRNHYAGTHGNIETAMDCVREIMDAISASA